MPLRWQSALPCWRAPRRRRWPGTIKWLHLETNPNNLAAWEEIAAAYEAAHPETQIEFQFLENEAFKAKLPTLLQSNDPPSMFYTWGGGVLKEQSETGAIREIDPAFDADDGPGAPASRRQRSTA